MQLFLGFYFGVLLMIILYNFHWYTITKEKSYLYYGLFKIFLILLILQVVNIIFISQLVIVINTSIVLILILLFSKEFLNLKKNYKSIDKYLNYLIYFIILYFFYSYFTSSYEMYDIPYSLIFLPLIILGFFISKKGFRPAIYFTISWGLAVLFLFVEDLNRYKIIDFYSQFPFSMIGHILESIILSYAIFFKTSLLLKEKEEQSKILIHQSKLVSMGQMLENISHQWRQPLNRISSYLLNMQMYLFKKDNDKYLLSTISALQIQLEYMSNTINDFTNFNKSNEQKEDFFVSQVIDETINIIGQSLKIDNIKLDINIEKDFSLYSYKNALGQVILNFIQNSQDSILQNSIKNSFINIIIKQNQILVQDNAGGIKKDIIDKIFEPYFTTKEKSTSLGLGLYMSKIILDKYFDALIDIKTKDKETTFYILF